MKQPNEIDRPTFEEIESTPEGKSISVEVCTGCGQLHIFMFGEDNKLICHGHLDPERWFDISDQVADQLEMLLEEEAPAEGGVH